MKTTALLLLIGTAAAMVGCASVRHLQTTPPAKTITLPEAVTMTSLGIETILPAGDYFPAMEDDRGYYYEAPAKIIMNDTSTSMVDGGLYLLKGSSELTHYYYINRRGVTAIRKLKTIPEFELTQ